MTSLHRVAKTAELEVLFTLLTSEPERCFQARKSSTSAEVYNAIADDKSLDLDAKLVEFSRSLICFS